MQGRPIILVLIAMVVLSAVLSGCSSQSTRSSSSYPAPLCVDDRLRPIDCSQAGMHVLRHQTFHFNGPAQLTGTPGTPGACTDCTFPFIVPDNATGLTVEALSNTSTDGTFHARIQVDGFDLYNKEAGNPVFLVLRDVSGGNGTLTLQPDAFPTASALVAFKAYVTVWSGDAAPSDWSYLAGDR